MGGRAAGFVMVGALLATLVGCSDGDAPGSAAARTVTVTASVPSVLAVTVTATPGTPAGAWTAATVASTPPSTSATTPRATRTAAPPAATRRAPSVDSRAAPPPSTRAPATRVPAPAAPARTTGRAAGGVRVPQLVGNSLTAAFAMLSDLGVPRDRRSPHDSSGKGRTVLNPDNWQVCNQKPAAGSTATAQTVYQLGVVKYGERC